MFIEIKTFSLTNLYLKVPPAKVAAILSRPQCVKSKSMISFSSLCYITCRIWSVCWHTALPRHVFMALLVLRFVVLCVMMTSSNGNIFRVTGPLWGESTGDRWIPLTKASNAELWCLRWSVPDQTVEQTIDMPMIWDAITLIMTSLKMVCDGYAIWVSAWAWLTHCGIVTTYGDIVLGQHWHR